MKTQFLPVIICVACLFFKVFPSFGQLTGIKSIPGDYASVSLAVTAINSSGTGAGGVTFNVAANYTENITATISLTATGTAANPIIFQKDPATTGANPVITAYTTGVGTPSTAVQDGIWRLVGSDYVTIDGIDVSDNPLNTTEPATMEYGYALYKATTSNGCQFVTIQNCVITLSRSNNTAGAAPMTDGSAGIVVMNALPSSANAASSAVVVAGSNSNNGFYSNTIQNCNIGISLIGYAAASPYTLGDANNDLGGSSAATGNTIINYGGASGATNPSAGIRTLNQYGLNVSYNTVNNNTGLGINHSNALRGILIGAAKGASSIITYNKITVKGGGTTQQLTGIENASGSTPAVNTVNISNNSITNSTYTTATTGNFFGINNSGAPTTLTINSNTVSNNSSSANSTATTTGLFYEILNSGAASTVTINNNILTGNSTATSIGLFAGIYNSVTVPVLNINGNTLAGDSTATITGLHYSIYNAGSVTTTVNINSNNIGTPVLPAIKFTGASATTQLFIYNYKGATTSALSISYNNFYNVVYVLTTAASNTYISNASATKSQVINSNTFTNLNVNISGNITFISNAVIVPATGKQDIDSNAIVGTFTKTAGGTVTLCTGSATSVTNSIINNNNNNFSNITLTGATTMAGWVNTDAGNSTKTIRNNVFSKWNIGTGSTTALNVSLTGINNATTGNIITNIVSAGSITGISTTGGNDNIYSNTIDTLISTGTATTVTGISVGGGITKNISLNTIYGLQGNALTTGSVKGIYISAGATINVFQNTINALSANAITTGSISGIYAAAGVTVSVSRNKIYDLSSSSNVMSTGIVYGVLVNGSTAGNIITIQNNLVGDLRTPSASAVDPIRGMSISSAGLNSTIKVYNNTIYLNGVSGGTNFGSTGLYHSVSSTSTTARLDLKNNIIINTSTATGTGLTVAYRRSGTILTNYDSTSNNNLFYAGTPATNRVIFTDGTTVPDQLLTAYKTRMAPRDAQSVTEDMITLSKFISTAGSSPFFLHLDSSKTTQAESGGINIANVTTDFDGQIRQGNIGYNGTGTAPDIGADETGGNTAPALSGIYNVGIGQTYTSLTNAGGLFASVNSLGLSGNVIVKITSDLTEDGTNVLYQWAEKGTGNYTLTIQPDAPAARLISGNVLAGMIRFNGAKRVIIDGSNGTVNSYLTFRNTNTAATTGTAFTYINGATGNTIRYCNIEATANATNGVMLFGASTAAGGNNNNTVSNCNINAIVAGVSGNICIYSAGTVGKENTANTISNNRIFNYRDRALDITATGSKSWTISGNSFYNGDVSGTVYNAASTLHGIRILGGSGYTIANNYIGGNAALAAGTIASYSSVGILSFQGILLTTTSATPASVISGNTIANISVSAVPTVAASANVFIGIETNGSGINIGGTGSGDGNTVGSNTANGSILITTTTSSTTFLSIIRGINCNSAGGLITGNQVGGIDINNIGTSPGASTFNGIYINNAAAPSQVNNNIIGSSGTGSAANSIRVLSTSTSTTTQVAGIMLGSAVVSAIQADGNLIKNVSFLNSAVSTVASGGFIGISSAATGAASITITNNTVTQDSIANYTSGLFYGIYNSGAASTVSINNNTLTGNSSNSASGLYYAILNTGAVTTAININGNNIGNSTTSAFTFNAINSGNQIFISNVAGTGAAALSVSNNNFQGINYFAAGTGNNTFISNGAATLSQAINGNTFTNLNVNTAGNVTFISDNVSLPASGAQNINNNSIVTGFTKKAGGTITLFTTAATTSAASSVINNNNNNFSNITALLTTVIAGWSNLDIGTSVKTIQNNIFSKWIGGTGSITAISVNSFGTNSATTGNLISNISGAAAITGIATTAGNDNIFSNIIDTLTSNSSGTVTGIGVSTAGAAINIYKNKIFDLSNSGSGTVYGISVASGTSVTIYNNLIGNFRTPVSNAAEAIRGISITSAVASSAINVYYNTIYLNASSSGTSFGTSGIFHTASATSTTATLTLRNNSITNTSASASGKTVAFRRSAPGFTNYASTSNNNLFYAGAPASGKLVFFDGTTGYQAITAYKAIPALAPTDSASISEDLTAKFLSTSGSSAVFLHMSSTAPSGVESGGANIAGYADDVDGQIRAGNPGYTGMSSSPEIGADEIFGIEATPPTITYTLLTNTTSTANRSVTGISITDGSGVNVATGTKPRIYYKRFSDANAWLDNSPNTNGWKYTEATNSASPFTFTIDYSLLKGGSTVTAGAIQYFIVAQDIATTANVAIESGAFAATPSSVALTSTAFPITGTINSYTISYSGTYNVGTTEIFTSLTKADGVFASINSAGLAGNTTFNITTNLNEDGSNALNQWAESGVGNYTLTIKSSAATLRTISGNVAAGLIRLDGAARVTIDGSISGSGSYLSFKNTNTAGTTGTAFTFINGAVNNTIRYCDAQAYADAANGVILFGASAVAGGNSNNRIDNCTINATVASNSGNVAIFSAGTTGNENVSDTISNSSIFGYRDRGVDITATGSSAWSVSGNSIYNGGVTAALNYAASATLHGIRILGGSGYAIQNNYIGGSTVLAAGPNAVYSSTLGNLSYQGILLTTSSSLPASNITGNTIAGISLSSVPTAANSNAFTGIEANGSGINIGGSLAANGNTIGSLTNNGSIAVTTSTAALANTTNITGINYLSGGGIVNNNHVGGFDISNIGAVPAPSSFQGIYVNNGAAPTQVNNNLIGSTSISNSIRVLAASTSVSTSVSGIVIGAAVNSPVEVNSNRIENISNLSTTSSGSFTGINNIATLSGAVITISSDTIQLINTAANSNAGSTVYAAIVSSSACTVSNNLINNITLPSTGINAQVTGINVSGGYASTVSDNIISNLSTASNKIIANVETGSPAASAIIGLLNSTTAGAQIINNNRFSDFTATSAAAANIVVAGMGITSTSSGNIFNNRFGSFTNIATGSGPAICHIMASGGTFNAYNNALLISNLTNTNSIKIYGIVHASSTNWNYFHNSVRLAGSSNGVALRSAAFLLSGNSSPVLKDNIFFNVRAGTGSNYAISNLSSPPSTWASTASDYNDFYSINANTTGEWGSGTSKTFAQWQSLSGGDAHSINDAISFIISTHDLEPDSVSNCAFVKSGTPITTPVLINTDINSKPRSTISPDLGAYEFSYIGFTVIAGSNSPVCGGDSVYLTANPGKGISPHFSWTNPANVVVSTLQNPALLLMASGQYKVTVTDSTGCSETDSTLVLINQRPTAHITSQTSLCDSGIIYLNIAVTGIGIINGTLSNGDDFSGIAPLIIDTISVSSTTDFYVTDLSDSTCTSIPSDMPDTVTVMVTHLGEWLGVTTNWHDPVNWCGGILPTSLTDVTIPIGTPKMPVITDSVYCNNLIISIGDSLTITGTGTLNIAGVITNNGTYNDNGTTNFNGTSGQQTFSGVSVFNNLMLNNAGGLLLPIAIIVKNNLTISAGVLNANNFGMTITGNWINNVSTTAFTAGTAIVTFNNTTAKSIGGSFATTFNNLTIASIGSIVSLNVSASIAGDLSVSSGTFDLGTFGANRITSGGILTVANNAILKIGGTNTYPTNYTSNILVLASTVEYSGTNQIVSNRAYGNLTLSSSAGAAIKTLPSTALILAGNLTSTLGSGTSLSFIAGSNITVNGNVSIGASTTFNGGSYSHSINGNWTNFGTFTGSTSTIIFTRSGAVVSGTGTQNFNNLTVAASGITFSSNSITLTGNLATSGSGSFTQGSAGTLVMSGAGTTISGTGISLGNLTISGTVTTLISLNISSNLSVSGSFTAGTNTITMSGTAKTISGTGTIGFGQLYITGSVTSNVNFSISSGLTVSGSFSASAGTATFTGTSTLSGTANLFNAIVNGTSFQLSSGSVLGIANIFTITSGTLDATTSTPNTINFNGTGSQNINAITYSNLVLSNGNIKTAVGPIITKNDITIGTGTIFNGTGYTHSIYGSWFNNGTFIPGTSTVEFLGPSTAYVTGATTFNILTSNTSSSSTQLILQSNVSAAIVNMTNGVITTGASTLTITNTRTGNGYIYGNIKRTHAFTTGVAYAFEGPDNTITFASVSGVTSVTVSIVEQSIGDFPFGGSISRVYNIGVPSGTYNATLRLHYEDDEVNGNDESSMALWHYNGSSWGSIGKTANSTTSNYVEQSGLTDITNRWTLSDDANLVQWNGSVSSDWNTPANWTALQGSASGPPSATDIVDLGTASFTNQPAITTNVTVKNIVFGSVQAVTLTLGSGGSLTTNGDINGDWTGNATHTINVNNQSLIVMGNLDLSDGAIGHAINLNIGSGNVTIGLSLTESGGANIYFSGAGTLNIYEDFVYSSGTFTAGNSTVTYYGSENQDVASLGYNNLTINKTGGLASINNPVNIGGNLLVSSGELDNFSTTTIEGDVTINAGDTIQNYNVFHVHGNWNNNGVDIGNNSFIYFDGAGSQNVAPSTFYNVIINKPVGTSAILTGDVVLKGDLTILSGTLDIKTFNCDRNVPGGTITLADSATIIFAANNTALNFSNAAIANASTVIANGTTPQSIVGADFGNLIFRNTGTKTLVTPITVNGNLTIESGSSFDAGSQTVTLKGNWINNGTFTASASTLICSGTGKTLSGNTTFNHLTTSGSYTAMSDLTFNSALDITTTGSISAGSGRLITLNGDLTNYGVWNINGTVTFTGNVLQTITSVNSTAFVATNNFNGSVPPVFHATTNPQFNNLNINNTGGINPLVGWTVNKALTIGSGASFNGGVATHNILGSVINNGTITSSGILNFIPTSAATINLGSNFSSTGRVIFGGAGAMTLAGASPLTFHNVVISSTNSAGVTPSSAWTMTNNFTVNNGSIFNAGNFTDSVGGKISNNGTLNSGASTFVLNGSGIQDIFTLSNFNNLTLKKTAGLTTLSSNTTVNGVLNFIAGNIQTGSNLVIQPSSGTISGAAQNTGWVNGNLQKSIATGANVSRTFETGDSLYYTPVNVLFANVSVSGNLTARSTGIDHPQIDLSGINKNLDVNRYWTLTNTGVGFTTATSTFNWVAPDVDAGATPANFKTSLYNGSSWGFSKFASPLPTSIQATGLTSLGSFVVGEGPKIATWTGAAGTTDWFTAGNWFGGVPDGIIKTLIPTTLQAGRFFPVISTGTATVDTLTIQSAATLAVTNSTLQVKGSVINNGTIDASKATIEMTGSSGQSLAANTFQNNAVNNLIISNTSIAGVTLGGALDVYGSLTYSGTGMNLNTGDSLTLKSTALNTAWIGVMTGNTITGDVTIERYISPRKAWRLLSVPTNTTQTIHEAWMEGCGANQNCVAGFGTQITGAGGTSAGFDLLTGTPSMKTYSPVTNTWVGIPNTSIPIKTKEGYIIFIRGDRGTTTVNATPTQTILRTKGSLYTGDQPSITVGAGKFASIGNPYASVLDMRHIAKNGLKDFFYVWDPYLGGSSAYGGYQTFSYNGSDYVVTPGLGSYGPSGSVSNYIQSGQAFLVQADSVASGSVVFKEDAKASGSGQVSIVGRVTQPQLRTSLYGVNANNTTYMVDGTLINYDDGYSNQVDNMDAIKSTNTSENLAIKTGNTLLVIERRQTIIKEDTIFLNLANTKVQKYRFQFTAEGLSQGLTGFLEDTYLHTSAPLNLNGSTVADFSIVNVPGSYAPNRFRVVFKQLSTLPVTFTSIKAYQVNKDISVEWKAENENNLKQYNLEKSLDGNRYITANIVAANNTAVSNYNWLDVNPSQGYNYYRVLSTDVNGKTAYSTVVKVYVTNVKQSISIYPNPVTNNIINLLLTNQAAGNYGIRLLNNMGQVMISKQINHAEGSSTETIQLNKYSAHGIYQLEITRPDGNTINMEVIY